MKFFTHAIETLFLYHLYIILKWRFLTNGNEAASYFGVKRLVIRAAIYWDIVTSSMGLTKGPINTTPSNNLGFRCIALLQNDMYCSALKNIGGVFNIRFVT